MGEYNAPLMRKIWEQITAHPEQWDQNFWVSHPATHVGVHDRSDRILGRVDLPEVEDTFLRQTEEGDFCGTAYCVAGWAVYFEGSESARNALACLAGVETDETFVDDEADELISREATRLLGLSDVEAHNLFWFKNSLSDVQNIMTRYLARQGDEL